MLVNTKKGVDKLVFGMAQKNVEALYGLPDKQYKDEEENVIYVYNSQKIGVPFYKDEKFKLGYLICANENLQLLGNKVIGEPIEALKAKIADIKNWEVESFELTENHFNEENWLLLVSEFGIVTKIELGATINDNDEFDWKY